MGIPALRKFTCQFRGCKLVVEKRVPKDQKYCSPACSNAARASEVKTTSSFTNKPVSPKPRILFIDIETFPNVAYVWGKYQQDVIEYKQETCIATYAAKWLDEPVFAKALNDYDGYKGNSYDDKDLVADMWKLLDEADIVVAHNGDDFDVRVMKARFMYHGHFPPRPFKTVDTKKVAKKAARFNSNRLDDIGNYFGLGRKIKTDFSLWRGCIEGDSASWAKMVKYNKQDVVLLEKVYKKLLPWINNHPNMLLFDPSAVCPKCSSQSVQYRGYAVTSTRRYRRFQCQKCGGWGRSAKSEKGGVTITNCI
jgi:DNA polymerase elongation subunit (family B)